MSTADFASFSDNAIMFASIVYVLALVAHVVEWSLSLTVREPAAVATGTGAGSVVTATPPPVDDGKALRIETAGRIGIALTAVAAALHLAGVVTRSFATDPARVPWGNMYEFSITGALGVTLVYLVLLRRLRLRWMGLFVVAFEVLVLMAANLLLEQAAGQLVPSLHSYWLVIHVGAIILASGAFAVGALASTVYLLKERVAAKGKRPGVLAMFPETAALDRLAYRVHAVGFPLWTFAALIAGPIWAEYAWGSYWNWDPKEVWAFITWVIYAAYLHARATAGWKGRAAAIIALIGFASLLFNFVGINFFFGSGSMHSYAGN